MQSSTRSRSRRFGSTNPDQHLSGESSPAGEPVDWRRNLAALWFAEFTAIFGFSFNLPFLALFLHNELHVRDPQQLALWTGAAAGASGITMALVSPIWGVLADRYGRRSMLLRAIVGGALSVGLMGFSQSPSTPSH